MLRSKYICVEYVTLTNSLQNGHPVTLLFASNDVRIDASGVASRQDDAIGLTLQIRW